MPPSLLPGFSAILLLLALASPAHGGSPVRGQDAVLALQNLKGLSIEDLMTIDVTSANRRDEPIGSTATAVSVVTRDDIRRAGVTTLAEALRLADGIAVARFNNGTWAITPRGFNQNAANKLQVMVDGVSQYSPLFTGVFWNTLDYVLDDVERIEVIRGPGAVLWGANAVNGVVNIITRSARDTAGGYALFSGGNEDHGIAEVRYGAAPASGPAWRAYGKFANRDAQALAGGASAHDAIDRGQAGFRVDGGAVAATNWLIKGDVFHSSDTLADRDDGEFTNGALQTRWSTRLASSSRVTLQAYFRREYRSIPLQLTHHVNTIDVDAQHEWSQRRHTLVWGGGVRRNADETIGGTVLFDPANRKYGVANVFAQDEFAVVPGRVFATLGAKWEHNAFSGAEFQPNLRVRINLGEGRTAWAAMSRAVRRPTRFEDDLIIPAPNGATLIQGSDAFEPESLVAIEAGYRAQPWRALSIDVSAFHHTIDSLRSQDAAPSGVFPITIGNSLIGRTHGVEAAVNVQPVRMWRTHVSYTWLDTTVEKATGSRDVSGGANEADDPHHQFNVRSSLDLPRNLEFDALWRSVSELPNPVVPAYRELTLRIGWLAAPHLELWFAGQDLLHDQHPEFGPPLPTRVEFERALRVGVAVRF